MLVAKKFHSVIISGALAQAATLLHGPRITLLIATLQPKPEVLCSNTYYVQILKVSQKKGYPLKSSPSAACLNLNALSPQ